MTMTDQRQIYCRHLKRAHRNLPLNPAQGSALTSPSTPGCPLLPLPQPCSSGKCINLTQPTRPPPAPLASTLQLTEFPLNVQLTTSIPPEARSNTAPPEESGCIARFPEKTVSMITAPPSLTFVETDADDSEEEAAGPSTDALTTVLRPIGEEEMELEGSFDDDLDRTAEVTESSPGPAALAQTVPGRQPPTRPKQTDVQTAEDTGEKLEEGLSIRRIITHPHATLVMCDVSYLLRHVTPRDSHCPVRL